MGVDGRNMDLFRIELDTSTVLPELLADAPRFLSFQELPEELSVAKSVPWHQETIPGRSEPWLAYGESSGTTIDFSVKFFATGYSQPIPRFFNANNIVGDLATFGLGGVTGPQTPKDLPGILQQEVHARVDWVFALTFPQYDKQGRAFPPPSVYLRYGANFVRRGVIVSVRLGYKGPWNPEDLTSYHVEATISFQEANLRPLGYDDVRRGIYTPNSVGLDATTIANARRASRSVDLARSENGA